MPAFLEVSPGLVIWTLINFAIFVFIIGKFGWKPMMNGLKAREDAINDSIKQAEQANAEAQSILRESKDRIAGTQQEMMTIIREGKEQAEAMIKRATDEAEVVKQQKVAEAQRAIEREKDVAINELRKEVSSLVIDATEKMLGRSLSDADQKKLAEEYVNELSKN
jgi:F-type H+-transporting ATPase subunit b